MADTMINCKKCGKETGPAFGLCAECVVNEDRTSYIEFRVYLKDGVNAVDVIRAAEELQDRLTDFGADYEVDIFTEDVTYKIEGNLDIGLK